MPDWTPKDVADAIAITDGLWATMQAGQRVTGGYAVGWHAGIRSKTNDRVQIRNRVRHLMPLVAAVVRERHPGHISAIYRDGPGSHVYAIVSDSDLTGLRTMMARHRKAVTAHERSMNEVPDGTPEGRILRAQMQATLAQMRAEELTLSYMLADAENEAQEAG